MEEMRPFSVLAICCGLFAVQAFACQETILEYPLAKRIVLLDADGKPLKGVSIVVREAFGETELGTVWGAPIGKIVRRGITDQHGNFGLRGLDGKQFWLTYDDSKDGETFFFVRQDKVNKRVRLNINRLNGRCYLFDIEHNRTKPPGWHQPIQPKNSN
jgi:hypothetical protein